MKTITKTLPAIAACFMLFAAACSKNSDPSGPGQNYSDKKGTKVNLSTMTWYAKKSAVGNGGSIGVFLEGSTNADKVTIRTSGDGVLFDYSLKLNGGKFSDTTGISFTAAPVNSDPFKASTIMRAIKGTDTLVVTLDSPSLQYQ